MKNVETILMFSTMVLIFGCKSPENSVSNIQGSGNKNIEYDISLQNASAIDETINNYIEKLESGKYEIVINHTEYDTDKPINISTGKPPVKNETKTTVSAQEDTKQTENTTVDRFSLASTDLYDKSKDNTKIELSEKSKTAHGFANWQIIIMSLGLVTVFGFTIWLLKKFKVWKLLF